MLQELGGWSDYEMVRRYAHLSVEHLTKYADGLTSNSTFSTNLAQSGKEEKKKANSVNAIRLIHLRILARPEGFEPPAT